ncbi:MAG: hypothetical protein IPO85_00105 [Saprospiraceae bacterium]|uniref:Uncharacterized protein n=1 Tax=Candidatus Defluviibacterium haderslevense TaxID=2981993 RepID=A0A9D7S597_9BACT|nr:hypothetical protein [Candidatus Defluviibacterium haderslevense]
MYAYGSFSKCYLHISRTLSKSTLIATYALSGFANFASIEFKLVVLVL